MTDTAEVWIDGWQAGVLQRVRSGRVGFRPNPSWALSAVAPVLGQRFIDDPTAETWGGRTGELPSFFANLLPQGLNRELAVEVNGVEDDLDLLLKLGSDLPGSVVVKAGGRSFAVKEPPPAAVPEHPLQLRLKASLTGMQPKFSMSRTHHGFTLPAAGVDGDWIVKLPGRLRRSTEVEQATMCWARGAGLRVPESMLVPLSQVEKVPAPTAALGSTMAFASRRFDRPAPGKRTHQEDFAQILGLYPRELSPSKGRFRSHGAQGRIVGAVCPEDLEDWVCWVVFNILCGNSDAHQKNLALWYPEPRRARLAPFYDVLAQIVYPEFDKELELHVGGVRSFYELDIDHLLVMGRKMGHPISESVIRQMVDRTQQAWLDLGPDLSLEEDERTAVVAHLRRVPLAHRHR